MNDKEIARQPSSSSSPDAAAIVAQEQEIDALAARLGEEMGSYLYSYQKAHGLDELAAQTAASTAGSAQRTPACSLRWDEIATVAGNDPAAGLALWERVKASARAELHSGQRAAQALEGGGGTPMDRARFLVLREALCAEWQPRSAGERLLLDQLAIAQTLLLQWTHTMTLRMGAQAARDGRDREVIRKREGKREGKGDVRGEWIPARVSEAEAMAESVQMVDRWNRMYLRTLRQLRDLRRYVPAVTINNAGGGQVNIAAEGGQQVNLGDQRP